MAQCMHFMKTGCNGKCLRVSKPPYTVFYLSELIQKTQFAMIDPVVIELQKVRLSLDKIGFRIT